MAMTPSPPPPAIKPNIDSGSSMAATPSPISTGLRPTRSDRAPANGVTAMTATAAIVDSPSERPSATMPEPLRKAGT